MISVWLEILVVVAAWEDLKNRTEVVAATWQIREQQMAFPDRRSELVDQKNFAELALSTDKVTTGVHDSWVCLCRRYDGQIHQKLTVAGVH